MTSYGSNKRLLVSSRGNVLGLLLRPYTHEACTSERLRPTGGVRDTGTGEEQEQGHTSWACRLSMLVAE